MARNNLELKRVGDVVYLNFWDAVGNHGDVIFEITSEGTAWEQSWSDDEHESSPTLTQVNLAKRLFELATDLAQ